jgi:hypothetical protein
MGLATAGLLLGLAAPATAAGSGDVTFTATIGGATLSEGTNDPIVLRPTDSTVVAVKVTNNGASPIEVRAVRLRARVLGLAFFSYTTRVDLTVAPGESGTRTFALDLGDLDGQATGLLPTELALLGTDRGELAAQHGTVDVKGKLRSVYGVFGLAIGAITLLLLLTLFVRLVRRTLPDNRWSRAVRFAVPGLGLGLTVTFTLGVLRVLVPSVGVSIGLLVGGTVVGFVLGYLTPSPGDEADRDELDERDVAAPPVVPATRTVRPTEEPATAVTPAPLAAARVTAPPVAHPPVSAAPPAVPADLPVQPTAAPAPPAYPSTFPSAFPRPAEGPPSDARETRAVDAPPPPPST